MPNLQLEHLAGQSMSLFVCWLVSQGDVDRQFLGPANYPLSLLLRGCHPVPLPLSPSLKSPTVPESMPVTWKETVEDAGTPSITNVSLACGEVLGLREKEPVVVYHICRPERRVRAQLIHVGLLSSTATICEEEKQSFQVYIKRIYEVKLSPTICKIQACLTLCMNILGLFCLHSFLIHSCNFRVL